MPADDGLRLDDDKDVRPARPQARQNEPKGSVDLAQARAARGASEVGQLLAKGEVFERQLRAGAEGGTQRSKDVHTQAGHGWIMHEVGGHLSPNVATVGKRPARMNTWRTTRGPTMTWLWRGTFEANASPPTRR